MQAEKGKQAVHRFWQLDVPVVASAINRRGDALAVACGDGAVRLFEASDLVEEFETIQAHEGVSLSLVADSDEQAFLSGGDDGVVCLIDPHGAVATPIVNQKGKWIDHVAAAADGTRAFASGKNVFLLEDDASQRGEPLLLPSSAGGMAFSPNSKRLAVSHYNGISLIWAKTPNSPPEELVWKGSHLPVMWHPDGKIVLSSMQEGALHGWRLSDMHEMQMQGYITKITSMAFTSRGKYLVTSGADQVICWPFFSGGPWGKPPVTLGGSDGRVVTSVAPNPNEELVAAGYEDGMIILSPLDGRMEMMLYPPSSTEGARVIGLHWNGEGNSLFAIQENGTVLLFTTRSLSKAYAR